MFYLSFNLHSQVVGVGAFVVSLLMKFKAPRSRITCLTWHFQRERAPEFEFFSPWPQSIVFIHSAVLFQCNSKGLAQPVLEHITHSFLPSGEASIERWPHPSLLPLVFRALSYLDNYMSSCRTDVVIHLYHKFIYII